MTFVLLGHIGRPPRPDEWPRRTLLALNDQTAIVVVNAADRAGWRCTVIARRHQARNASTPLPRQVVIAQQELARAHTHLDVAPDIDPDGYAMLWQTRVTTAWPGGRMPGLARHLAEIVRAPGSLVVDIGQVGRRSLAAATYSRPAGLHILLTRLIRAETLQPTRDSSTPDRFILHLPDTMLESRAAR